MTINIPENISKQLNLSFNSVKNVLALFEEGSTIPFIARYRKERTGSLDEVKIQEIKNLSDYFKDLQARKETILKAIEEQDKLTKELEIEINQCIDKQALEDFYLPYKKKKQTRAMVAITKGLESLANIILLQQPINEPKEALFLKYVSEEKGVLTPEDARQGALDVIAEYISDNADYRKWIRIQTMNTGLLVTKVKKEFKEAQTKFEMYYDFSEPLKKSSGHRLLAIRRGSVEKVLGYKIQVDEEMMLNFLKSKVIKNRSSVFLNELIEAIADSYKRLIYPSIENECFREKLAEAEAEAIQVFAKNVKNLLLASPVGQKVILALDPGFRTGCKVAVVDKTGQFKEHTAIYPHEPQKQIEAAAKTVLRLVAKYNVEFITIGNGTASKETDQFVNQLIKKNNLTVKSVMVSESGASIYSASSLAREEFPDLDVTVRGAISIARRLQDPLAELIKIDPKSIGVGQYQHDVNQKELKKSLDFVVEYCVNHVGVNLNTASYSLLSYVSGISPTLAKSITEYRSQIGAFKKRSDLKKVPKLGPKAFEQCAGFLRISDSVDPLDNTSIHPEAYPVVKQMAKSVNCSIEKLIAEDSLIDSLDLKLFVTDNIGLPTLKDIIEELKKPGLDPRAEFSYASFQDDINEISDLKPGQELEGVITNVTNFGAFVDIGVHQDGLVHISKLSNTFVKDPNDVVSVGQPVSVKVIEVDEARKRISLERVL